MHLASRALAAGADFALLGPASARWCQARVPVIAISAVRTGCGKSPDRALARPAAPRARLRVAVLRHPMPYGDLERAARAALRDARGPGRRATAPRRSARSTSRTWPPATSCSPASTTRRSSRRPSRRPTSSCGTAATTTSRSWAGSAHRHGRRAAARTADWLPSRRGGAAHGGRGRRQQGGRRAGRQRGGGGRRGAARNPRADHREGGLAGPARRPRARSAAGGSWWWRTGPPSPTGAWPTGRAMSRPRAAAPRPSSIRGTSATPGVREIFARYPHIGPVLPAVGYDADQLAGASRDDQPGRRGRRGGGHPARPRRLIALEKPVVRARYEFADAGEPTLGSLIDTFLARHAANRLGVR